MVSVASWARGRSLWMLHYETGSCNGCAIEVFALQTPVYDLERFGVLNTGNPKHADLLVVTGCVGYRSARVLKNLYHQMPGPKAVVAVGVCALTGGIFHDCYNLAPGVDKVIPVDVYVPGCAPWPEAMLDGVLLAAEKLRQAPVAGRRGRWSEEEPEEERG